MSDSIRVEAELTIPDGEFGEFEQIAKAMIAAVRADEPDTLSYEWYLSADKTKCCVSEWYRNSDAMLAHVDHIGEMLGKLLEVAPITSLKVYGNPSHALEELAASFNAQVFRHWDGVTRDRIEV